MKVLMTGCTSLQIGNENRRGSITKIDVPASVVEALEAKGHEVDWRKVTPGDDLSAYDAAWVNMAPINSLNGRAGAMGALWTLSSGLPCVSFADDWQFSSVFNGMRALVRRPDMLTKYMLTNGEARGTETATHWSRESVMAARDRVLAKDPTAKIGVERYYMRDTDEEVLPHADRLVRAAQDYLEKRWDDGMVIACPMYAWGDRTLVRKRLPMVSSPIEALDPSSTIYPLLQEANPRHLDKKFEWVLGALMPHDDWVEKRTWTWNVNYLGSKTMVRRHGGQRLKTELDVINTYNDYWGILSPPYPHAGSGWWRSRFMYAAKVGSVLCCDRGEGAPLGRCYEYKHSEIEKLAPDDLLILATEQSQALRRWLPDNNEGFVNHVNAIVARAIEEDKGGAQ
jgi:hypothetical protein